MTALKVLLTGATGRIGSVVARHLKNSGHAVFAVVRSDAAAAKVLAEDYAVIRADLADSEALSAATRHTDAVIHTAFTWGADAAEKETAAITTFVSALGGTEKPLIATTGAGLLGDTGKVPAIESRSYAVPRPWRADIEAMVTQTNQLRGIVVRPSLVFDQDTHAIIRLLVAHSQAVGAGVYVADGQAQWSTVDSEDLAALYLLALERAEAGAVLHAGSGSMQMRELAGIMSVGLGFEGRTQSWPVDEAARATPFANSLSHNIVVNSDRALRLGWQPKGRELDKIVAQYCASVSSSASAAV